jgi:nucleoside-diphosphate-sugar epimerase
MKKVLVTGGSGFLGAGLVKKLVHLGYHVRVLDNNFRGRARRLTEVINDIEFIEGDIRDQETVNRASKGIEWMFHLAFVNGTRFFYEKPGLVLEVGVKGALTTMDAVKKNGIEKYILASSSEVYQEPTRVPTDEHERIIIPDVTNPRFSYSGGKLISELLALHYLQPTDTQRIIFRPHNVYGPDMGWEHVVPEFMLRLRQILDKKTGNDAISFPIQGTGKETRAFCYVDDAVDGIVTAAEKGTDGNLYHVGVDEEVTITDIVNILGKISSVNLTAETKINLQQGSTTRRCPDIGKLRALGYDPKVSLEEGLRKCWEWYKDAIIDAPVE